MIKRRVLVGSERSRVNRSSPIGRPSWVTIKDCPRSKASMISRDLVRKSRWVISDDPLTSPGSHRR
jgi:hypothetical protein